SVAAEAVPLLHPDARRQLGLEDDLTLLAGLQAKLRPVGAIREARIARFRSQLKCQREDRTGRDELEGLALGVDRTPILLQLKRGQSRAQRGDTGAETLRLNGDHRPFCRRS